MVATRILDITVLSADDLKNARIFSKMNVYAIVSVSGEIQTTSVDKECGKKPTWNQRMRFNIDEADAMQNNLNVVFSLKSHGGCFGGCVLGEVCVPVKDMLCQSNGVEERTQSYNIITPSGRTKGTLHIAYKFGPSPGHSPNHGMAYPPPPQNHPAGYPPVCSQGGYPPPQGGYPPPQGGYPPQGGSGYAPPLQDHYHHNPHSNPSPYPQPGGYPPPNTAYPPPGGYPPPGQTNIPYPGPPSPSGGYPPNAGFQGHSGTYNYPPPPPPGYDNVAVKSAAAPGPRQTGYPAPLPAPGPGPAGIAAPQPVASPPPPQQQNNSNNTKKAMAAGLGLGVGAGVLGGMAAGGLATVGLGGGGIGGGGMTVADSDSEED
ncbi:Protein SRC2-like [Melia azedarach]|uniref:Protein SRC2-like n=1 Tax=Melia azedarach TaxID=155640 RepID=A0ACC1Y825_MELAZ|nr:Protein SRC2-like [Melia azedarach]